MLSQRRYDSNTREGVEIPRGTLSRDYSPYDTSTPLFDLPISSDGLSAEDFSIPTREIGTAQSNDGELKLLRDWLDLKQRPSPDVLAPLSGRMNTFAQCFD